VSSFFKIYSYVLFTIILVLKSLDFIISGWSRSDTIDENTCYSWPSAGGANRGVVMKTGSCLAVFKSTGCVNANGYITQRNSCYPAHIYSARVCTKSVKQIQCPNGSWVRTVVSSSDGISGGLSIECEDVNGITSGSHNESLVLIQQPVQNPIKTSCETGIGGFESQVDTDRRVILASKPLCNTEINHCLNDEKVTGISVSIEEYSEYHTNNMIFKVWCNVRCIFRFVFSGVGERHLSYLLQGLAALSSVLESHQSTLIQCIYFFK